MRIWLNQNTSDNKKVPSWSAFLFNSLISYWLITEDNMKTDAKSNANYSLSPQKVNEQQDSSDQTWQHSPYFSHNFLKKEN